MKRKSGSCYICPSIHEKIWFPALIRDAYHNSDEGHVIRPMWPSDKIHLGLFKGTVSFYVVASCTGTYEIFPGFPSAQGPGHDVIHGHRSVSRTAVLALVPISLHDVPLGKYHLFMWDANVEEQPDDTGDRISVPYGVEFLGGLLHDLCLSSKDQNNRSADTADINRFVALVED